MNYLHNTDAATMAYINLYGVLGCLEELCRLDEEAKSLIADKKISIGFVVKGGPAATLYFDYGTCTLRRNADDCDIRLPFSSPEKFNGMINGTVTPIPNKGLTKIPFLLKTFTKLTDILSSYLQADEEALKDPTFREKSTTLMFYLIATAIAQIGNHDQIGKASAGYLVDGTVELCIQDGPAAGIVVKNHRLHTVKKTPEGVTACMKFGSMEIARNLFEGKINAVASIGTGDVRMNGMISMLDNVNRILDRVGLYLA